MIISLVITFFAVAEIILRNYEAVEEYTFFQPDFLLKALVALTLAAWLFGVWIMKIEIEVRPRGFSWKKEDIVCYVLFWFLAAVIALGMDLVVLDIFPIRAVVFASSFSLALGCTFSMLILWWFEERVLLIIRKTIQRGKSR